MSMVVNAHNRCGEKGIVAMGGPIEHIPYQPTNLTSRSKFLYESNYQAPDIDVIRCPSCKGDLISFNFTESRSVCITQNGNTRHTRPSDLYCGDGQARCHSCGREWKLSRRKIERKLSERKRVG
jgi:hypothetical protein